jgi:hypothetical protein
VELVTHLILTQEIQGSKPWSRALENTGKDYSNVLNDPESDIESDIEFYAAASQAPVRRTVAEHIQHWFWHSPTALVLFIGIVLIIVVILILWVPTLFK